MAQRAPLLSSLIVSQLRSTICTRITPSFEHRRNSSDWQLGPNNPFVKVSDEVREAINQKRPVVALETTIYTHGGTICIPRL